MVSHLSISVEAPGDSERSPESSRSALHFGSCITALLTLADVSLSGGLSRSVGFSADLFGSDDAYFPA